jgi:hypothetical protein
VRPGGAPRRLPRVQLALIMPPEDPHPDLEELVSLAEPALCLGAWRWQRESAEHLEDPVGVAVWFPGEMVSDGGQKSFGGLDGQFPELRSAGLMRISKRSIRSARSLTVVVCCSNCSKSAVSESLSSCSISVMLRSSYLSTGRQGCLRSCQVQVVQPGSVRTCIGCPFTVRTSVGSPEIRSKPQFGVFSHVVFSGLVGAAIGWVVSHRERSLGARIGVLAVAFVGAVSLHAFTNWAADSDQIGMYFVASAIGVVALVVVLIRARRSESARLLAWDQARAAAAAGPGVDASIDVDGSRRDRTRQLREIASAEREFLAAK